MKDRPLIDRIDATFIALTPMAIHHCLSACITGKIRVPPEFGSGGGAQCKWDGKNITHGVNNACTDVFCRPHLDFWTPLPEVQAKKSNNIRHMICAKIHSTGVDPAMGQSRHDQGCIAEDFLDQLLEELTEQPDNPSFALSSFVAANEAYMRFWAVHPMGGSAIAWSRQPIPCSDSPSNSNDITNITSIENPGLVDGSTIVECVTSLGGQEWCQWSDLGIPFCAILF